MIRFEYDGSEYGVVFYHGAGLVKGEPRRASRAVISKPTGEVVGKGESIVHPLDTFDRLKGRRLALKRALEDAFPGSGKLSRVRCYRKACWDAYFAECRDLKGTKHGQRMAEANAAD